MNSDDPFATRVLAAEGYIELGMPIEATEELDEIEPEQRFHPMVVGLRVQIYRTLEKWDLMQTAAKILAVNDPDNVQWTVWWAYATRRADSIDQARLILVNAVERQPNVAIFHYNLACYDCQLGNLDEAKVRLKRAFELEPRWREKGLEDEDLKPWWDSLK